VSHSMGAISTLCNRAMLLEHGRIKGQGPTHKIIELYMQSSSPALQISFHPHPNRPSISGVSVDEEALRRGDFLARIKFESPFPVHGPVGGITVSSLSGVAIWGTNRRFHLSEDCDGSATHGVLTCHAPSLPLIPSKYTISAWLGDWYQEYDQKLNALSFDFKPDSDTSLRQHPN